MSDGPNRASAAVAAYASAMPIAPPAVASTRLSMRSWRASRLRVAPSAARTPISRERPAARPSSRPATLTHASSSTVAAAPASATIVDCAVPTISSFSGTARGLQGLFAVG